MADAVLQSRSDRDPPAKWIAELLAALHQRFPKADLGAKAVEGLYPSLRDQWRRGQTISEASLTLSSCDGKTLQAAAQPGAVPKVRAPQGAKPGQLFGIEDLRNPARTARLIQKVAKLEAQLTSASAQVTARGAFGKDTAKERQRVDALRQELGATRAELNTARTTPASRPREPRPRSAIGCPPKQSACKLGLLGGVCGLPAPLVLAAAQGAPIVRTARYCLTSVFRLRPSHIPHRGFVPNPSYPADVQERAYDRDKAEQLKVIGIAQNLVPELVFNGAPGAIDGLPVVTADGIVLGGNGRTMALQLHYQEGQHVARDYLLDHARQFGFTRAQVEAIADPVVVRVVDTSAAGAPGHKRELSELVRLLNIPLLQTLDARSESVAEAKRLTAEVLEVLAVGLQDDMSLAEYLSSASSRTLIAALRRSGSITNRNAARLLIPTGDSFSEDGKRFVERLLVAALIPDAQILDRMDGRVREALARSAPWWLSAAAGGKDWDLREALGAAVRDLIDMRREGAPSVDAYLRQVRMGEPAAVTSVPLAEKLLRLLVDVGTRPTAISKFARTFAASSRLHPSAQGSLLPTEKLSPVQALEQAARAL